MSDGTSYNIIVKPHLLYASLYLSVVTQKLRLRLMCVAHVSLYTSHIHTLTVITLLIQIFNHHKPNSPFFSAPGFSRPFARAASIFAWRVRNCSAVTDALVVNERLGAGAGTDRAGGSATLVSTSASASTKSSVSAASSAGASSFDCARIIADERFFDERFFIVCASRIGAFGARIHVVVCVSIMSCLCVRVRATRGDMASRARCATHPIHVPRQRPSGVCVRAPAIGHMEPHY